MEDVDRPLTRIGRYQELKERKTFELADGLLAEDGTRLQPDAIDMQRIGDDSYVGEATGITEDGFIFGPTPYDLCWGEAVAGCSLLWSTGHVWSEPFLDQLGAIVV